VSPSISRDSGLGLNMRYDDGELKVQNVGDLDMGMDMGKYAIYGVQFQVRNVAAITSPTMHHSFRASSPDLK
jgi:hypothetical protein